VLDAGAFQSERELRGPGRNQRYPRRSMVPPKYRPADASTQRRAALALTGSVDGMPRRRCGNCVGGFNHLAVFEGIAQVGSSGGVSIGWKRMASCWLRSVNLYRPLATL